MDSMKATILLSFRPEEFEAEATRHQEGLVSKGPINRSSADRVRQGFKTSLLLVICAGLVGWGTGTLVGGLAGTVPRSLHVTVQYTGIGFLLWATLGQQGWSIQTYKGQSLVEQVNEWVYRALHVIGSWLLVTSATWPVQ